MSPFSKFSSRVRKAGSAGAFGRRRDRRATRFVPDVGLLEGRALLSTLTVTNTNDSGPGSLRDAIDAAASGDTIDFAPSAYGTITLSSASGPLQVQDKDLTIDGPGAALVTISGGGAVGDFVVATPYGQTTPNVVTISGLTIADGNADGSPYHQGGAIMDFGTKLTVSNCVLRDNQAPENGGGAIDSFIGTTLNLDHDLFDGNSAGSPTGTNTFSLGGAIYSGGTTTVTDCTFQNNLAIGPYALGGAIHASFGSTLAVVGSTFAGNRAQGTVNGYGEGDGGAIFTDPGTAVSIASSRFLGNEATAAKGNLSGGASGGALYLGEDPMTPFGVVTPTTITDSTFTSNRVVGAGNGNSVNGGAINANSDVLEISGTAFADNQALGGDGTSYGDIASGGAISAANTQLVLTSDAFLNNLARSGSGPNFAGFALGGAINSLFGLFDRTSTIDNTLFLGNQAIAGTGPATFSLGGALLLTYSPLAMTDSSFLHNQVVGSQGIDGGAGGVANGGAIYNNGSALTIQGGIIASNSALGGDGGDNSTGAGGAGGDANGGGVANQGGTATITGTLILANTARGGDGGAGSTAGGAGGNGVGGGIETESGSLTVIGVTITGNQADGGSGGDGSTPGADGQGLGGGIAVVSGTATVTRSKVFGNRASTAGNDIYGTATVS